MKWKTLEHNGIIFPPPFETKSITVKIRGQKTELNLLQEEMAYQWAKKKDTPYVQDAVFQNNFTADFAKKLGIKGLKYNEIDFGVAYAQVDREKEARERMTKEERKALAKKRKEMREDLKAKYGMAMLDGKEVELGNYMAEPPGIFIGRGDHPFRGKWKRAITKKDVTLNLGKGAKRPPGDWGEVVCRNNAIWLACWIDDLTKKAKYIWFADTVGLKQDRDKAKYDKAVILSDKIDVLHKQMISDMKSKQGRIKNISTVCYLIYRTAMRVGDEKDSDEEANTVGATTLRKEHVKVSDNTVEFDFLGKDSVRWKETLEIKGEDAQFRDNLKHLMADKKPTDEIFTNIASRDVNEYLTGIIKGVSAKVFRTYLGSNVVNAYLAEHTNVRNKSENTKIYHAKLANLRAAKMLNHKRTIPKSFAKSLEKKRETLKKIEAMKTKTPKQAERKKERIERLKMQLDLAQKTSDYNLGTSLRNYVDPRVVRAWTNKVGAKWEKIYTTSLQRKFLWVQDEKDKWEKVTKLYNPPPI